MELKKLKRTMAMLMAVVLVFGFMPAALAQELQNGYAVTLAGFEPMAARLYWNDGDIIPATDITTDTIVTVTGNVTVTGQIRITDGASVTITGGGTIMREGAFLDLIRLFGAEGNTTLTLNDITIDGNRSTDNALVDIRNGGTLIMNYGSTLQNGGQTAVWIAGGTFTMNSGTISGNSTTGDNNGGGVNINSGTFNLYGGTIVGNSIGGAGDGVFVSGNGTLNIRGDFVSQNEISSDGNINIYPNVTLTNLDTIHNRPGGTVTNNGTFDTSNGEFITDGTFINNGTFIYERELPPVGMGRDPFYVINFARETISFGQNFYFARLDQTTREPIQVNGNAVMVPAHRSEITFIFNRRADRIRVDRGTWISTANGEPEIHRHLRRGGYIGVRRTIRNQHELIAIIEIPARPSNRDIRPARRNIYVPSRFFADAVQPGEFLHNPTYNTLEIRIGNDTGIARTSTTTERLAPGETYSFPHDFIPRGTRGTFRIAPEEKNNFALFNGEFRCVRELLLRGVTQCDNGYPLQLGEGSFGSNLVRFRIPNQPAAPLVSRMAMTEGRNGAQWFISRTNSHMRVLLGADDDGNPVWSQLAPNTTINGLISLFTDEGFELPTPVDDNYEFEVRFFRNNRIVSAPGFLRVNADNFRGNTAVRASVSPIVVSGTQNDDRTNAQNPLNRNNGISVVVTTSGGRVTMTPTARTAQNRADVASWFGGTLPEGLTATLTRVQGARATITIHGIPTQPANNVPMVIEIPYTAIEGGTAVQVYNAIAEGNAVARFNIAPEPIPPVTTQEELHIIDEELEPPHETAYHEEAPFYEYE